MKVLIIGAGIGGLTTYLALQKHLANSVTPFTVKIYESYGSPTSTTSSIGGGLGLAPNGLRSFSTVSPRAIEYMQERGFPGPIMTFRNSSGRMIGQFWGGAKRDTGMICS
jgi:2-polyprenyl-6-methoxyphenol hydroxylase-like FAD-dependent oxidoreductase